MLEVKKKQRIVELTEEYVPGWRVEVITAGYKISKETLVVRFLNISKKDGDYYCRVLIEDTSKDALYAKRTDISDDQKLKYDIEQPMDFTPLSNSREAILGVVHHFRHALHKQADEEREEAAEETFEIYNGKQSLDLENWPIEKEREVVAGFAVRNGYTLLFGDAGVGKSLLAHNIGLHAASDQRYLGFHAILPPIKVLYLSLEMYYDEFRERQNQLMRHFPESVKANFHFLCPTSFDFTNAKDRSLLANTLEQQEIKLLIVDSHNDWRGDKDMNDNTDIGAHIAVPLMEMMRRLDFSTILLHHTGWQGSHPTGAKILWNNASLGIRMEEESGGNNLTKITFVKWRNTARKKPRPISLKYDAGTYLIQTMATVDLLDLLEGLDLPAQSGKVTKQIMGKTGLKERQAKEKKAELIRMGHLVKKGRTISRADERLKPITSEGL